MAEHVWTVLCEKVLNDLSSHNTSLIEVIERFTLQSREGSVEESIKAAQVSGEPGILVPANLNLVSWWIRSDYSKPEISHFRFAFINPDGARLHEQVFMIDLRQAVGQRMTIQIAELPLSMLGQHWYWIEREEKPTRKDGKVKWRTVTRIPLELREQVSAASAP